MIYIGPWVPTVTDGVPSLMSPPGTTDAFDLRSWTAFQAGALESGLFSTPAALGKDYLLLGDGELDQITPSGKVRQGVVDLLGKVSGNTVLDWLWSAFTIHADPTGAAARKPIVATRQRNIDLHFGGKLLRRMAFDPASPEGNAALGVLREDYRKARSDAQAGKTDPDLYLKMLDYWGEQYGVASPEDVFIPADLPKEKAKPHGTTLSDDFNRASQTPLGTASGGGTWQSYITGGSGLVADTTVMSVVSNAFASNLSASGSWFLPRLESDLSTSNHYCQLSCVVFSTNTQQGPRVRCATGADGTSYMARALNVSGNVAFTKIASNGTLTDIASNSQTLTGLPKTLKLTLNGSSYAVNWNGSDIHTGTDTTISSGTRAGFFWFESVTAATAELDNWQASDVAAAVVGVGYSFVAG